MWGRKSGLNSKLIVLSQICKKFLNNFKMSSVVYHLCLGLDGVVAALGHAEGARPAVADVASALCLFDKVP